jgi:hypothetical protein
VKVGGYLRRTALDKAFPAESVRRWPREVESRNPWVNAVSIVEDNTQNASLTLAWNGIVYADAPELSCLKFVDASILASA